MKKALEKSRNEKKRFSRTTGAPLDDPKAPPIGPQSERPKTVGFPLVLDRFNTRCPFVIKVACAKGWIAPRSEEESARNGLKFIRRQKPRFEENATAKT